MLVACEVGMAVRSYRELDVWRESMVWVKRVYALTRTLPDTEKFGLVSQMQCAAVSVPANIAEGAAREHTGDYLRFVSIALGSLAEVETMIQLCVDLQYVKSELCDDLQRKGDEIGRMLRGLQKSLRQRKASH